VSTAATARASEPVLRAERLTRRFGGTQALESLSLELFAGEIYGLVGPDGAGKTTALRILAGMIAADGGVAEVLGRSPLTAESSLRSALGYMPQQFSLYGDLSVEENLRFFARMFCLSRAEYRERRARLLRITRLEPFTARRADALSGGMYKKLALACVLLPRPRLLLMDEPTNGVDPVSRRELWALLFELAAEGMAILVSTPYMDEAVRCARVGLIQGGRLLLEGEPARLLEGFEGAVLEASGAERGALEVIAERHPATIATSVAGGAVRALLRPGAGIAELRAALEAAGARVEAAAPSFEDLFLSVTAAEATPA
jgi:ABC-2 type transport system ATP-binding protein